ncbi:hypothetical protein AX17_005383 [Amanita inopinata Kibby_2008]|nr:hypothetical protein AX17_005383 [Amanita inopinata Kibby_2008]
MTGDETERHEMRGDFVMHCELVLGDVQKTLVAAYYTGGAGGQATGPTGDPVFSQGAVAVSQANNLVAVVNLGSSTVTLFLINSTSPTKLIRVGSPTPSGGDFPNSVGFNSAGTVLCALNTGKINNVSCFKVSLLTGLTPLVGTTRSLGLNQTTPPSGPDFTGSQVIFSPDDSKVLAAVKGASTAFGGTSDVPGFVAEWTVNAGGSLSSNFTSIAVGLIPWSVTPIRGTTNGYVTSDGIIGYDILSLATPSTPAAQYTPPGTEAVCWSEYSPATGNYYLTDFLAATVIEVSSDESSRMAMKSSGHVEWT